MATIRKRKPKQYRDGGRVVADPTPNEMARVSDSLAALAHVDQEATFAEERAEMLRQHAEERAQMLVESGEPIEDEPEETTLDLALAAAQRVAPKPPPILEQIAALSDDKFKHKTAQFYHAQGLAMGIPDNSPEMAAGIEAGIKTEMARLQQSAVDTARALAVPPAARATLPPLPPAPERQRSIPMSAPPSRATPSWDGRREPVSGKIKLSVEERMIARNSYSAPEMTDAQKEYAYAMNKKKYLAMKANGDI